MLRVLDSHSETRKHLLIAVLLSSQAELLDQLRSRAPLKDVCRKLVSDYDGAFLTES